MPQLNQLADVAFSQFFWLLLTLGLIYFGIGRAMLPKIQSTVDARDKRIAEDLAAAASGLRKAPCRNEPKTMPTPIAATPIPIAATPAPMTFADARSMMYSVGK